MSDILISKNHIPPGDLIDENVDIHPGVYILIFLLNVSKLNESFLFLILHQFKRDLIESRFNHA